MKVRPSIKKIILKIGFWAEKSGHPYYKLYHDHHFFVFKNQSDLKFKFYFLKGRDGQMINSWFLQRHSLRSHRNLWQKIKSDFFPSNSYIHCDAFTRTYPQMLLKFLGRKNHPRQSVCVCMRVCDCATDGWDNFFDIPVISSFPPPCSGLPYHELDQRSTK